MGDLYGKAQRQIHLAQLYFLKSSLHFSELNSYILLFKQSKYELMGKCCFWMQNKALFFIYFAKSYLFECAG